MKIKTWIFVCMMLVFLSVSAVSAGEDINQTLSINQDSVFLSVNEEIVDDAGTGVLNANMNNSIEDNNMMLLSNDNESILTTNDHEWYVNVTQKDGDGKTPQTAFTTLKQALDACGDGDTINIASGTYKGSENIHLTINKDNLKLIGYGDGLVVFDAESKNIIFKIYKDCTIEGLTFKNGKKDHYEYEDYGGAIYSTAKLTVVGSTFYANTAEGHGGAIYSTGLLSVDSCSFVQNQGEYGCGGAIYSEFGLTIKNSIFKSNRVPHGDGGAVYCEKDLIVVDSVFDSNGADAYDGGAIYCKGISNIKFSNFTNNKATREEGLRCFGGAIRSKDYCTVDSSVFTVNFADNRGGAIYGDKDVSVNNCTFNTNSVSANGAAENDGGAIYASNVYASNSTFSHNSAKVDGGAIYTEKNTAVYACTFESNNAKGAKTMRCFGGAIHAGKDVNINYCVFNYNYAENKGGAVYADTVTFNNGNASSFYGNTARDYGGAIYTSKFTTDISYGLFIDNKAENEDGGAIYINNKNDMTFTQCVFINNHCGNKGGAIYMDSKNSHLALSSNIFSGNSADDQGGAVFNCGYYSYVKNNWWDGCNPSSDNKLVMEWKALKSNIPHLDADPLSVSFTLDKYSCEVGDCVKGKLLFYKSNGNIFTGKINNILIDFNVDGDDFIKTVTYGSNNVTLKIIPLQSGIYSVSGHILNKALYSYQFKVGNNSWCVDSNQNVSGDGKTPGSAFKTLKEALDVAVDGDTIYIASGRYTGIGENVDLIIDKKLNLIGWGDDSIVFDGQKKSRIFTVNATQLIISRLTFENGNSVNGSALYFSKMLSNSSITATFVNNKFGKLVSERAKSFGGAVFFAENVVNSIIVGTYFGNDAFYGGANFFNKEVFNSDISGVYYGVENPGVNVKYNGTANYFNEQVYNSSIGGSYRFNHDYFKKGNKNATVLNSSSIVWYVDANKDSGVGLTPDTAFKSLHEALCVAVNGDTIMIAPGTYTGIGINTNLVINKNLTLSASGDGVVFDGQGKSRIFTVDSSQINIIGLTFKGGQSDDGGALLFSHDLVNSTLYAIFDGNKAENGGAVYFCGCLYNVTINGRFNENHLITSSGKIYYGGMLRYGGVMYFAKAVYNCWMGGVYTANGIVRDESKVPKEFMGGVRYFASDVYDCVLTGTYVMNIIIANVDLDFGFGGVNYFAGDVRNLTINGTYMGNLAPVGGVNYFDGSNVEGLLIDGVYVNNHAQAYSNPYEGMSGFEKHWVQYAEDWQNNWKQILSTLCFQIAETAITLGQEYASWKIMKPIRDKMHLPGWDSKDEKDGIIIWRRSPNMEEGVISYEVAKKKISNNLYNALKGHIESKAQGFKKGFKANIRESYGFYKQYMNKIDREVFDLFFGDIIYETDPVLIEMFGPILSGQGTPMLLYMAKFSPFFLQHNMFYKWLSNDVKNIESVLNLPSVMDTVGIDCYRECKNTYGGVNVFNIHNSANDLKIYGSYMENTGLKGSIVHIGSNHFNGIIDINTDAPDHTLNQHMIQYGDNVDVNKINCSQNIHVVGKSVMEKLLASNSTLSMSLQELIDNNVDGIINLERDYTLGNIGVNGVLINKNITINGNGHIIDAQGLGRIFTINASSVNITNLVFVNGKSDCGGAIFFVDSVSNSNIYATFMDNQAVCGGAIYFDGQVYNSNIMGTYIDNRATDNGGAIYFSHEFYNSSINGMYFFNQAKFGGVNYFSHEVYNSNISGRYAYNRALEGGGANFFRVVSNSNVGGLYRDNVAKHYGDNYFMESSSVNITYCRYEYYPYEALEVEFKIPRYNNAFYEIKDSKGRIVKNGTTTMWWEGLEIKGFDPGEYTITITNPESGYYLSSSASANFSVSRLVTAKVSTPGRVTYGEPIPITLTSDYDSLYNLSIGDVIVEINVVNGSGVGYVMLSPGSYVTHTTIDNKDVKFDVKESLLVVDKCMVNISITMDREIVYPNNIIGVIKTNAPGIYELGLSHTRVSKLINLTKEPYEFDLGSYSVMSYRLTVVPKQIDENYMKTTAVNYVYVIKGTPQVVLSIPDCDVASEVYAYAHGSVDGLYTLKIGGVEKTMKITNGVGSVNLGYMNIGIYNATLEFDSDKYYNPVSNMTSFTVSKNNFPVDSNVSGLNGVGKSWYVDVAQGGGDGQSPDSAFTALKEALNVCRDGDVIYIASGRYVGLKNVNLTIDKKITVKGYGGDVIFDAEGHSRVFTIDSNRIILTGLTFMNGMSRYGGALHFIKPVFNSVVNATFICNHADCGGAIYFDDGVSDSFIGGEYNFNEALDYGGAIYYSKGVSSSIVAGTYVNNTADCGGVNYFNNGVYNSSVTGVFINNSAKSNGGGNYFDHDVYNSNISGRYAYNRALEGGANFFGDAISNVTVDGIYDKNEAEYGGANFFGEPRVNLTVFGAYDGNVAEYGPDNYFYEIGDGGMLDDECEEEFDVVDVFVDAVYADLKDVGGVNVFGSAVQKTVVSSESDVLVNPSASKSIVSVANADKNIGFIPSMFSTIIVVLIALCGLIPVGLKRRK